MYIINSSSQKRRGNLSLFRKPPIKMIFQKYFRGILKLLPQATQMSSVEFKNGVYKVEDFFFKEEEFQYDDDDYEPIEDGEYIWKSDKFYIGKLTTPIVSFEETVFVLTKAIAKAIVDRNKYGITEKIIVEHILDLWLEHDYITSNYFPLVNNGDDIEENEYIDIIIDRINEYFYL